MPMIDPRSAGPWAEGAANLPRFPRIPRPKLQIGLRVIHDPHAFDVLVGAIKEEGGRRLKT